jgi:hypothetical protein
LEASNNPDAFSIDAASTEALAIHNGLYLANQLGANKLIMQSDYKKMIEILGDGGFTSMPVAPILEDISILVFIIYKS